MDATTLILHHYPYSPYAEKIRLLLGAGGLSWASVISPEMPPRPYVDPLTGGYRRIPVLQVGADVFCDTALIAREIACLANNPLLGTAPIDTAVADVVRQAEGDVFFSAITGASQWRVLTWLVLGFGVKGTLAFMKDRQQMMASGTVRPPRGAAARAVFEAFLAALDEILSSREWLSGTSMGYADAAVYHPIWFKETIYKRSVTRDYPHVTRWFSSVTAIGHGTGESVNGEESLAIARHSEPRPLTGENEPGAPIGETVTVTPGDYARIPVRGQLVEMTDNTLVLARDTQDLGRLHVYFPRSGYEVEAQ